MIRPNCLSPLATALCIAMAAPVAAYDILSGPLAPYADPETGNAEDLDGILVGGERVRLINIDNEDLSDEDARLALAAIEENLAGAEVTCRIYETNSSGRHLGICDLGDLDVGAIFVEAGFAFFD